MPRVGHQAFSKCRETLTALLSCDPHKGVFLAQERRGKNDDEVLAQGRREILCGEGIVPSGENVTCVNWFASIGDT